MHVSTHLVEEEVSPMLPLRLNVLDELGPSVAVPQDASDRRDLLSRGFRARAHAEGSRASFSGMGK